MHGPPDRSDRAELVFAVGAWVVMVGLLVRQLVLYCTEVPVLDDWLMIWRLRPDVEWDWRYLWVYHNEHRMPLAKAAYLWGFFATHDLRAGAWMTCAMMGAAALACIFAARRVRGRSSFADAFFPFLWLNGGQSENVLNSFQLAFSIPSALAMLALIAVWVDRPERRTRTIACVGAVAVLLPLCGVVGLVQVPAWLAWLAWQAFRDRRRRWLATGFVVAGIALIVLVSQGFRTADAFRSPPVMRIFEVGVQFLSRALGQPAVELWPASGLLFAIALATGLVLLALSARNAGEARERAIGLLVAMVACSALALTLAYGRAMDSTYAGLLERYGVLAAPMWTAIHASTTLSPPRGRILAMALFAVACATFSSNFESGERTGKVRVANVLELERDFEAGASIEEVARYRWREFLHTEEIMVMCLRDMEAARLGPFANPAVRRPDPPFEALRTRPIGPIALESFSPRLVGDVPVLLVSHGAPLCFGLGETPRRARGRFGVHPSLFERADTPPIRFRIEARRANGEIATIFERTLDVARETGDREIQSFLVDFKPEDALGELRFVAEPVGDSKLFWGAFWEGIFVR
jgi:hypothetical protein